MSAPSDPRANQPADTTSSPLGIRCVLVANRGEIASRIFATCRRLGISTVAVHSDPDRHARFVADADLAVALGGSTPAESYLRMEAIIEAAQRSGADAVHPGYGFLAENARFAELVGAAGLTWIGPSPEVITAMGSKIRARARMEAAGVPVLPGANLNGEQGDALTAIGERIGVPLLVKASAGGGGKGMRVVNEMSALESAVAGAMREAESAFGDATVFLERYAPRSRHVEIQIMGDSHGTVAALGERDCSIQRRHQKVLEESPSPVVGDDLRAEMSAAAVSAGASLGYVGAGTVEFLLVTEGELAGRFFFLEVNTRLQVEHPVTELVTGLDLVELQIRVAEGHPLPDHAHTPHMDGHAVEARLYAEDAERDFLPVTGTLSRFDFDRDVRVDAGVQSGSEVSPFYDPMLAKVIAWAPTRAGAVRRLATALRRAEIHGMTTNRDMLVRILEHDEFASGIADTSFLERHDAATLAAPLLQGDTWRPAAAAAAMAAAAARRAAATVLAQVPSGWRNVPAVDQWTAYEVPGHGEATVRYRFDRTGALTRLSVGEEPLEVDGVSVNGEEVVLSLDGLATRYRVHADPEGGVWVNTAAGQLALRALPRFGNAEPEAAAGTLTSPMPGTVTRLLVGAGAAVAQGEVLMVLEAMKMELEVVAPVAGGLAELPVGAGDHVETGTVLAVIDETAAEGPDGPPDPADPTEGAA